MQTDSQDLPHGALRFPGAAPADSREYGILIADDDAGVREVLAFGMRRSGFRVLLAADGHLALHVYRTYRESIDLALLDVRMPGMDGPQTLAGLRKLSPWLPCCFMSGDPGEYDEQMLRDLGASAIFNKPFHVADVSRQLLELLSRDPYIRIPQASVPETRREFRQLS